jgi:hypothetical protein
LIHLSPGDSLVASADRFKIPNNKHQITNKSQIPIFNDQNKASLEDPLNIARLNGLEFWSL